MIGAPLAPATPLAPYNLRPQGNVMPPLAPVARDYHTEGMAINEEQFARQNLGRAQDAAFNTYYTSLKQNPQEMAKFVPSQVNTGINGMGAGVPLTAQELESRQKALVRQHFDRNIAPEHPDLVVPRQNAEDATHARIQGVPVAAIRNQRIEAAAKAHDLAAPPLVPGVTRVTQGPKGTTSTTEYKPPAVPKEETPLQRAQRENLEARTRQLGAPKPTTPVQQAQVDLDKQRQQNLQAATQPASAGGTAKPPVVKPPPGAMTDAGYANAMKGIDEEVSRAAAISPTVMSDQEKAALKQKLMQERLPASRLPHAPGGAGSGGGAMPQGTQGATRTPPTQVPEVRATSVAPDYTNNNATAASAQAATPIPGSPTGIGAGVLANPAPVHTHTAINAKGDRIGYNPITKQWEPIQ